MCGGHESVWWAVISVFWGLLNFSQLRTPQVSGGGGPGAGPFQHMLLFASVPVPGIIP